MGEKSDKLKQHIEAERAQLTQNVNELEYRVRSSFDWRAQFREHAGLILGSALGIGVLLGFRRPSRVRASQCNCG